MKVHWPHELSKQAVPFDTVSVIVGNVPLNHPDRNDPQCRVPGESVGIMVPPVPMNRIHRPPILVLNIDPSSHVPPMPDVVTLREGSFTTVYDEHGGPPLTPPAPTSYVVVVVVTNVDSEEETKTSE